MAMNVVELLSETIRHALPDASITIDEPSFDHGNWWVDVKRGPRKATIEWRPKEGFGVGLGEGMYGEGPDIVASTIETAAQHVIAYLQANASSGEPTVLVASSDATWRSAIEEHLREHRVSTDMVETLAEATKQIVKQSYTVILVDLATTPFNVYSELRDRLTELDSLLVTVASADHAGLFNDSFGVVMHKRVGTEYVASVVESLVAAAGTGRLPNTHSESA